MIVVSYGYRDFFVCLGFVVGWGFFVCLVWFYLQEIELSYLSDMVKITSVLMIFFPFYSLLLKGKATGSYTSPVVKTVTVSFPGLLHQTASHKLLQTPTT